MDHKARITKTVNEQTHDQQTEVLLMLNQQQTSIRGEQLGELHSGIMFESVDVSGQLRTGYKMIRKEINHTRISFRKPVRVAFPPLPVLTSSPQRLTKCQVKKNCNYKSDMDSNEEFSDGQYTGLNHDSEEEDTGQLSAATEAEDPVDEEISEEAAAFIQFLMTNKQPDDSFRSLYNETHRPTNVPALEELKLNSTWNKELNELVDRMQYAQNCMLKGVTKTAYVMDTLFKHVDKLPEEPNLWQLMSDLNSAMRFFGATNLELNEMRKRMVNPRGGV